MGRGDCAIQSQQNPAEVVAISEVKVVPVKNIRLTNKETYMKKDSLRSTGLLSSKTFKIKLVVKRLIVTVELVMMASAIPA